MKNSENDQIRKAVRETYGQIAKADSVSCGCCGNSATAEDISVSLGYSNDDVSSIPEGANMGLGCGNPQAIASLQPGESVLDLGCGGGFDCFLAAKAVGDTGHVIGVDMTEEMITKTRKNAEKSRIENVEFRLGQIEALPVDDNIIDVLISNCVINLSPDKSKVFKEAFRVLKPGGRLAVTDIVAMAQLPDDIKEDLKLYTGCISGAALITDLESILKEAGFINIQIKPIDASKELIRQWSKGRKIEDFVISATIEATKP